VGKEISGEEIEEVIRAADKYGFNCAFEGGEAETFVVQAPLFKGRLRVKGEIRVLGEFNRRFDITEVEMMSL
jgi:Predicted ATPases of PP-loop superfamily